MERERTVTVPTFLTHTFWQTCSFFPALKRRFMRQGYGSQSNPVAGGFQWGACLWTSDEATRGMRKRCALYNYPVSGVLVVETARRDVSRKNGEVRGRGESFSHASTSPYLSPALFAQHSTISTPGTGYDYKQTASYTGVPRTRLNKFKNSALVLQKAINTETYVITSTTILNSFYSVYVHLLKCPPQSHCHFHCPPLFSLQDVWHSFRL